MNDLQTVTADAAIAIRRTDPFLFDGQKGEKLAAAIRAAKAAIDEDQALRTALLKRPWGSSTQSRRDELAKAGTEFTWLAEKVVQLYCEGRLAEGVDVRNKEVRPAFERYINLATSAADALLEETNRISDRYSSESKVSSHLMLSVASWPVLLGASLLFATLIFVVSLLLLFRARESAD